NDYSGTTSIRLQVKETSARIGINQVGLELSRIVLSSGQQQRSLEATQGDWERNWLSDGEPISPGDYTLTMDFNGSFSTDALGMYRVSFEQRDYVFTQMEAMYARRAFPLFDEPSFKIPYQLTISAPEDLTVVANTPPEEEFTEEGWQHVTFMATPPLPSYLIAFAVGPLESVEMEGLSVPGHVYVPAGHAGELGFVLRETPTILAALEDYFGTKYPYRKLDFIAVPEFAFGAMENPGLITYRTDLLLVGDEASGEQAVAVLNVIAHEVAHIWYGDLVTMAWWDDLWLNEAFATWMANTVLETHYPQYETELRLPQQFAFMSDELTTSRAIRATVRNDDEILENLGLNYTKGHALLRMLERYVGHDVWQRAIREYVKKFAWANAMESDLWAVVSEESGVDIAKIAGDYLNQPGFASVSVEESGAVSQTRYVRRDLQVENQLWQIPMNVKYKVDDKVRQTYLLLEGRNGTLDVPSDADWIFPDAGGNGYYRWRTSDRHFGNLVDDIDALSGREKIALLDNTEALLNAGSLSLVEYLRVIDRLLQDPHPLVFLPALEKIKSIANEFVTPDNRAAFAAFVNRSLSARYREVGMRGHADDSEAVVQMRPRLMRMLGEFGSDETLIDEAADLANAYLESPGAVEPLMALEAMRIAALYDDGSLYEDYIRAYLASTSAKQRSTILSAVYFDDPGVVVRHLEFSLSDDVQAGDTLRALGFFTYRLEEHDLIYDWLDENFDRLLAKAPAFVQPILPLWLAGSCERRNLDLLQGFFGDRGDVYAASLAKAVEAEESCIARRERHSGEFDEFLAQHAPL
ncbi:MAG: M1 family metallopeptidase, partial [Woeseiaceae bacterium]|nr:M1 family metallopeptidase [Woeseiaceae bacterium]